MMKKTSCNFAELIFKKISSANFKKNITGYVFIAPLMIFFVGLMGYSLIFLIKTSFYSVDLTFKNYVYVGIENYEIVLEDKTFLMSLLNTFILSATGIFVALTVGFCIAVGLSFKFKGRSSLTALFFLPAMLPVAFIAVVFAQMLEFHSGIINEAIRWMGIEYLDQRWLSDPKWAMASVCSVSLFLIGIPIMYYMADLSAMNTSIFEAGVMDGAKLRQIIVNIIYPMLKGSHKTIALAAMLGGFREMERVYLMTNGGPGGSTEIIGTYIFRNTRLAGSDLGFVAASSVIVLIFALIISVGQILLFRTKIKKR